jgi:hypothetical protein
MTLSTTLTPCRLTFSEPDFDCASPSFPLLLVLGTITFLMPYILPESLLIIRSHNKFYVTLKIFTKGCVFFECWIIPAMSPNTSPAGSPDASAAQCQAFQPVSTSQTHRPLRREGAIILLSPTEQVLEVAMLRSSPPPEQVLRKRTHEQNDEQEGGDTEPEEGISATAQARSLVPSLSNVNAATLWYTTYRKLRAKQRDALEAFLKVSTSLMYIGLSVQTLARTRHWAVKPSCLSASSQLKT